MAQTNPFRTPTTEEPPSEHGPPTSEPTDEELRRLAVRRLRRKRSFWRHVAVYVTVNAALWTVWIVGGIVDQWIFPWPMFPTVFWGLFVYGEARDVFWRKPLDEDQVQREIARLRDRAPTGHRRFDERDDETDRWCWPPSRFFDRDSRHDRR